MDARKSKAPDHASLKVKRKGHGYVKTRKTYELVGCSTGHNYRAYNNSCNAQERAIKERLLFYKTEDGSYLPVPEPLPGHFDTKSTSFLDAIKKQSFACHPLSRLDFSNSFKGRKKERYLKATQNLESQLRICRIAYLKYFLKYETYDFVLKPDAKPRGINPRSDEFLVDYGRRIKAIEKVIYGCLKKMFKHDVIFKGKNQAQRGALIEEYWSHFKNPVAIAFDASAFEASVSVPSLKLTHKVYNFFIRGDKEFVKLQKATLFNKGSGHTPDGNVKFSLKGKRASGDPDTAGGNCIISANMLWEFMEEFGLTPEDIRAMIDGDDVVVIVEEENLKYFLEHGSRFYLERGFRMIFEKPVREIERISFCQSSPIWTPDGYIMVRNPAACLAKDSISRKSLESKRDYTRWIASVGECGMSCAGGIPVLQEFYQQLIRNSEGAKAFQNETLLDDYRSFKVQGMSRKYVPVHDRTRYSFSIAFGIQPDEQICIENYFRKLVMTHGLSEQFLAACPLLPM